MRYSKTTKEELALVLEEGEGYTLEFKQAVNSDLPKELVAFANASGGRIFIGVNDHNKVIGIVVTNKIISQIQSMAAACDPPVAIEIERLVQQSIIVIHIPEGANRPYRCNKGFYLRNGANSQKMSTLDITDFIQAEGRIRFDQQLCLDLNWAEIFDERRLNNFLQLAKISQKTDTENLLVNLGAGDFKDGQFYFNQTGVLFFSKEPRLWLKFLTTVLKYIIRVVCPRDCRKRISAGEVSVATLILPIFCCVVIILKKWVPVLNGFMWPWKKKTVLK